MARVTWRCCPTNSSSARTWRADCVDSCDRSTTETCSTLPRARCSPLWAARRPWAAVEFQQRFVLFFSLSQLFRQISCFIFISAPIYYLKNSDGKCLTQYVTGGTSKTNVYNYNNMNFQACANGDSQKWYFLDKGAGSFQIVNVAYKCQLDCSSSNSVYLNVNSYDNDNQKWTSNGNNLQNKAYSNAYLTNNSGSPGLSIWSYSWTLQLVWISFNFML